MSARQWYVVGEGGWEFFKPNIGGQIFSHARSMAMMNRMNRMSETATRYRPSAATQYVIQHNDQSVRGGHTYDQSQITNNFQVQGSQSMRLALVQAKAFGR